MELTINNQKVKNDTICPSDLNYGQMQRWENHLKISFIAKLTYNDFKNKITKLFEVFRKGEMEFSDYDEDVISFPELFEYRQKKYPTYKELLESDKELLIKILLYNEYDLVHSIFNNCRNIKYSLQKLEAISFNDKFVLLKGIAFKL